MGSYSYSMKVKVLVVQLCLTFFCDPMNCSPPASSAHGILQERILEWVAIPFSSGSSPPRIEPGSPALQADSLPSEPPGILPKRQKNFFLEKKSFYIRKYKMYTQSV